MDEDVAATESREGTWPKRPCIALRALIGSRARTMSADEIKPDDLLSLPQSILCLILSHSPTATDTAAFSSSCKTLRRLLHDALLLRDAVHHRINPPLDYSISSFTTSHPISPPAEAQKFHRARRHARLRPLRRRRRFVNSAARPPPAAAAPPLRLCACARRPRARPLALARSSSPFTSTPTAQSAAASPSRRSASAAAAVRCHGRQRCGARR